MKYNLTIRIDSDAGDACYWVAQNRCSFCAGPLVELYTEGQATAFIHNLREAQALRSRV
jgi:hypothetical protein